MANISLCYMPVLTPNIHRPQAVVESPKLNRLLTLKSQDFGIAESCYVTGEYDEVTHKLRLLVEPANSADLVDAYRAWRQDVMVERPVFPTPPAPDWQQVHEAFPVWERIFDVPVVAHGLGGDARVRVGVIMSENMGAEGRDFRNSVRIVDSESDTQAWPAALSQRFSGDVAVYK